MFNYKDLNEDDVEFDEDYDSFQLITSSDCRDLKPLNLGPRCHSCFPIVDGLTKEQDFHTIRNAKRQASSVSRFFPSRIILAFAWLQNSIICDSDYHYSMSIVSIERELDDESSIQKLLDQMMLSDRVIIHKIDHNIYYLREYPDLEAYSIRERNTLLKSISSENILNNVKNNRL